MNQSTWTQASTNKMDAAAISPRPDSRSRLVSAAEVVVVTAAILVLIWVLQPLGSLALDFGVRILIVASMLASTIVHGDSARRLGIRLDNFAEAARTTVRPTAAAAVGLAVLSITLALPQVAIQRMVVNFVYYLVWGFAQQYALQGFVLLRLLDAGLGRRAPIFAAAVFALIHAPSPGLMALVFLGGWLWSTLFRREPNLLVLAISHAFLAVVADSLLPRSVTGGFRLGPAYMNY